MHDLEPEDSLLLTFNLTFNGVLAQQAALTSELEPFLEALEKYADGWMPDVVNGKRRRKYSRASLWKALLEEGHDEGSTELGLYRTQWPALDSRLGVRLAPRSPELDLFLRVKPLAFFAEEERCHQFIEMVRAWAFRYPVSHASAHSTADRELASDPDFGREKEIWHRDGFDKVYEVSWLNVFAPKLWRPSAASACCPHPHTG